MDRAPHMGYLWAVYNLDERELDILVAMAKSEKRATNWVDVAYRAHFDAERGRDIPELVDTLRRIAAMSLLNRLQGRPRPFCGAPPGTADGRAGSTA